MKRYLTKPKTSLQSSHKSSSILLNPQKSYGADSTHLKRRRSADINRTRKIKSRSPSSNGMSQKTSQRSADGTGTTKR